MTRSWTKNQELAINAAKGNILVSASAGSGKTSVLSARILKRICDKENNLDITDVVAVTFTVDAAAELKKRLLLGLQEAVARDPSNKKQNRDLLNIDRAKISTVHSLCKSIIDENFSLLSLPAKMSIINESKAKELLSKTSNELTDEYHRKYFNTNTSEAKCFYRLISTLCSEKSDASIAAVLESVYGEYRSYPFWKEKLTRELELFKEDIEKLKSQNDYFFKTKLGKMMRDELLKDLAFLRFMIGKTLACTIEDSRLKQLEIEEEFYKRLTSDLIDGSFNNAKKTVLAYKRPANRSCKNDPNDRYISSIRELSQKISFNEYFESEESELISQLEENYNISRLFTEMLIKFDERYTLAKVNTLSMDYGDLECYALKLLVKEGSYNFEDGSFEKSDVALKLTNSIKEIYVDEYQDTNLLQDMIFRAISDNNLFVVGDLKQSIYAFRGAMPDIFSKYKNEYEHYADNEQPSKAKIYLSDNFRSDNSVVSISNTFFLNAMSDFDTRDDVKDELLVKSKTSESGCKSELCVVMEEKGGITKEDYIVSKIKEVLKTVTSEKGGKLSLKDIGILAETNTEIKRITKALTKGGIPWTSEVNEPFLNSSESLFMLSLLNAIDNPANDVYLVGAMVYPVFCFDNDELLKIKRKTGKKIYWDAVLNYKDTFTDDLSKKLESFVAFIEKYRALSASVSVSELIYTIYGDYSSFSFAYDEDRAEEAAENLHLFYEYAVAFEAGSKKNIFEFSKHLESMEKNNDVSENKDCVSVQTIHKSKGLEYPVCIVCTNKLFTFKELEASYITDPDFISAFHIFDERLGVKYENIVYSTLNNFKKNKLMEEKKRLMYVAMTRARQKLIIISGARDNSVFEENFIPTRFLNISKSDSALIKSWACRKLKKNFLSMLLTAIIDEDLFEMINGKTPAEDTPFKIESEDLVIEFKDAFDESFYEEEISFEETDNEADGDLKTEKILTDEIKKAVNFEYFASKEKILPEKVSVSALYRGLNDGEENTASVSVNIDDFYLDGKEKEKGAFVGTAMHEFMQFCDFERCEREGTRSEAQRLVKEGFIGSEKSLVLNHTALTRFFESELYKRMKKSPLIKRELRFNVFLASDKLGISNAKDDVLIQGVIDCFFEEEDSFVLLDFKTDFVHLENAEEVLKQRYSSQLMIYALAIEEMTDRSVKDIYIYSFYLGRAVKLDLKKDFS